jgi:tRNA G18 (ribose-2'-O)-methylase SpoU
VKRFPVRSGQASADDAELPESDLRLEALLDNLRSAYNVGSILRTADGLGFSHVYLAGITPSPLEPAVRKTSLAAEASVPWSSHPNALRLAQQLKSEGARVVGLERTGRSVPITATDRFSEETRLVLVVGNERAGIDPELLSLCDAIASLPMFGTKDSYNVAVAFAMAAFRLRFP